MTMPALSDMNSTNSAGEASGRDRSFSEDLHDTCSGACRWQFNDLLAGILVVR